MPRGRPPIPASIHAIRGTFRSDRHGKQAPPVVEGALVRPANLEGRAAQIWDEVIAPASWLSWPDAPMAGVFCALMAEFEADPAGMVAARITNLRALAASLGLDPASRARFGADAIRPAAVDPASKYFD